MKIRYIYYVIIIAIVTIFGYLVTSNLYITIGCGLLYAVFFFFLADKKLNRYFERNRVTLECYSFIDSYVIGLSAKKSLKGAFESATTSISLPLKEQLTLLENMDEEEKIDALLRYFELDIYKMFCDIIHLFSENGGDILRMSSLLLNETRKQNELIIECSRISSRKLIEFATLWLFSLMILLVCRFGLQEYYALMITKPLVLCSVAGLLLLILFSFYLLIMRVCESPIKERRAVEDYE